MNTGKKLSVIWSLVGILALGAAKTSEDSTGLQGTWTRQQSGDGESSKCSLVFKGSGLEFHSGSDAKEWCKATFTLREDKNPKQLVAKITECGIPEAVGVTICAIYQIKDGTLTITGNEPGNPEAPTGFDAPGTQKVVLKRKPAATDTK